MTYPREIHLAEDKPTEVELLTSSCEDRDSPTVKSGDFAKFPKPVKNHGLHLISPKRSLP